jgi:hypothetical protein
MVKEPRGFLNMVLWPEFTELNPALLHYLGDVTLQVIRDEIHADAREIKEMKDPLPSSGVI